MALLSSSCGTVSGSSFLGGKGGSAAGLDAVADAAEGKGSSRRSCSWRAWSCRKRRTQCRTPLMWMWYVWGEGKISVHLYGRPCNIKYRTRTGFGCRASRNVSCIHFHFPHD